MNCFLCSPKAKLDVPISCSPYILDLSFESLGNLNVIESQDEQKCDSHRSSNGGLKLPDIREIRRKSANPFFMPSSNDILAHNEVKEKGKDTNFLVAQNLDSGPLFNDGDKKYRKSFNVNQADYKLEKNEPEKENEDEVFAQPKKRIKDIIEEVESKNKDNKDNKIVQDENIKAINEAFGDQNIEDEETSDPGTRDYDIKYNFKKGETLKNIYGIKYFLIFPDMKPKQYWDLTITLLVIISGILTPLRLAFVENEDSFSWLLLDTVIDLFFLADIIINFFTVYTNRSEDFVVSRKLIALNYLRGWFIIDFIAIIPVNYFYDPKQGVNDLARLARLVRLYKLVKLFRIVKQGGKIKKYAADALKLNMVKERILTFILFLTITCHVLSCMWYFSASWDDFSPDTWVAKTNYQDESDLRKYIYCFYFTTTIITTVGYGDMPITTSLEKIIAIGMIIVGVITFSFSLGSLMSVLENVDNSEAKFKEKYYELNSIKKKYNIPQALYNKLYKSLRFKISKDESNLYNFIETFPVKIRTELTLKINREIFSRIPYFKGKDEHFLAMAAELFKNSRRNIYKDEYLFSEDNPVYEIFFLLTGKAGYVVSDEGVAIIFCEIHPGNLFGELDFFNSGAQDTTFEKRKFSVKALADSEVIGLSKISLHELANAYPKYVDEIFEYANYRLKKLLAEKRDAMKQLHKETKKRKKEVGKKKAGILRPKTLHLEEYQEYNEDDKERLDREEISIQMKNLQDKDVKQSYGDKTKNLKEKAKIYFSGVNKVWKGIKKHQEMNKSKTDILFEHIRELAQQKREKDRVARENSKENKFKLMMEKKKRAKEILMELKEYKISPKDHIEFENKVADLYQKYKDYQPKRWKSIIETDIYIQRKMALHNPSDIILKDVIDQQHMYYSE
ncbi:unnamed protein product [Moneuplotes crassus]|uniref:Cyclic nucleotide-binding domain-containing protein n=1 Tax=Euplotes crassus TaxID=5936 RepID=A0AAD1XZZ8_EUPCR|nr:unnamed protein product [Moneuplotes crassus]